MTPYEERMPLFAYKVAYIGKYNIYLLTEGSNLMWTEPYIFISANAVSN